MMETIGLTAEMYRAVVTIVDERVKEIRVTREDFNELKGVVQELAQAQARTEERVGGLEQAMQELAQAQARTGEQIERLVEAQENLARQVGGLSDSIGYGLEDIAKVVLPGYLQRHFGIRLKGVLGEELDRHFFHIDGTDVEINLYGEGERDGQRVVVLGEAKSRIYKNDVEKFVHNLAVMDHVLKGEVVRVMFGYFLHPSAEIAARERDILLVASYQR
jgi:polyhydroxyalkanoate synthesis regulator phasin